MARPTTKQEFKDYCLRKLGYPVLDINISDDQVDDRVDEALDYYHDYHHDGTQRVLIRHQVTAADKTNKYITTDESIIGIQHILPIFDSGTTASSSLFSVRYQIQLNDFFDFSNTSMVPYYLAMRHIDMLQELLTGEQIVRWNRKVDRLHIDMDWDKITTGDYIIIDAYQIVDPNVYTDVWDDWWLKRYATALMKKQWGENLSKFEGLQLPGGVTFNGRQILEDAKEEINKLEEEMINSYSLPVADMIG
jgi:hypothetical protein